MSNFPENEILENTISISSKGVGYVFDKNKKETIEIEHEFLHTALHGDLVRILPYQGTTLNERGKEVRRGEVVKVLKRARPGFAGTIEEEGGVYFLIPQDQKLYTDILIPQESLNGAKSGQKVFVHIESWTDSKKSPIGKVIKILGKPKEHNAEMEAIILERGFVPEFPENVLKEAEEIEKIGIPEESFEGRRDFREITTFTIDPADAKDFDDALSVQKLPNGDFEIGIHIADVSHYVRPGSALDKEAVERQTSVYMVDRTIPMLPEVLSNNLCSLVEGEPRLTMSAVFVLDQEAKVKSEWFGQTVIFSDKRFTYEEAQDILIGKRDGPYREELGILNQLAKKLHEERARAGSIFIEQDEIKFKLDENGVPVGIYKKSRVDSHKLIEEFMLLANKKVAERVNKNKKTPPIFIYRIHDLPDPEKMIELKHFLKTLGHEVHLKDGLVPSKELNRLIEEVIGKPDQDLVQTTIVRSMQKAIYSVENVGHFSLAFEHYTHFTSPIRRYPDVLVHRLLSLYEKDAAPKKETLPYYEEMCARASEREKYASDAERGSIKYKQVEWMSLRVGAVFDGVISGVSAWGIYIEENESRAEGMIKIKDLGRDFFIFDEKHSQIVGEKTKKTFRLGDKVKVRVVSADLDKRLIDYALV